MEDHQVKVDCGRGGLVSNDIPSATSFISVRSSMMCAETLAAFLHENHSRIQQELEEGLARLGYNGEYRLQAGFDEELVLSFNLRSRVFLFLNGDLQHDVQSIYRVISPIFAPYATLLYAESKSYYLIEPHELAGHGTEESSTFLLPDSPEEGIEEPPMNYRRRLELDLDMPLTIESASGKDEFNINASIEIELRSNRSGDSENWPVEEAPLRPKQKPWCSIDFKDIILTRGGTGTHSLELLTVRMTATPFQTMCREFSPVACEFAAFTPTAKKRNVYPSIDIEPEANPEIGREQVARGESTRGWSLNTHCIKQSHRNTREVTVSYMHSCSEQDTIITKKFTALARPCAVFSYQSDKTTRTIDIFLQAFWVDQKSQSALRARFKGMSNFPTYGNFLHKTSIRLNLKDLIDQGGDDLILKGDIKDIMEGDIIQHTQAVGDGEELFKEVEIRTKADEESVPLMLPLHHAPVEGLQGRVGQVTGNEPTQPLQSRHIV